MPSTSRSARRRPLLVVVATAVVVALPLVGSGTAGAEDPGSPATATATEEGVGTSTSTPASTSAPETPGADPSATGTPTPADPSTPEADPAAPEPGDLFVGELVQAYGDPGPATPGEQHGEDDGTGLLSWIRTDDGGAVRVPTDDVADIDVGDTVEVTVGGTVPDEATAQGMEPAHDVLAAEVVDSAEQPRTASTVAPVNHQVTVVMMQPGGVARDSTTLGAVTAAVNGRVGDFWEQQSGGAVRFGVVRQYDWATTTATCADPFALWEAAARRADNWSHGPGKHLLVYVPRGTPGCSDGLGTVGRSKDDGGLVYVTTPATSMIAHEFGHNLGLGHSSELQCDGRTEGGTCAVSSYNDWWDVMGFSWDQVGTLNAAQAALLGVLPAGRTRAMAFDSPDSTVTLVPAAGASGVRAIKLTTRDGGVYWLEYRAPTGQDAWLGTSANWPGLDSGLQVRRASTGNDTSLLLDATPSALAGWSADLHVALGRYDSLSTTLGDFRISLLEVSATELRVRVDTPNHISAIESTYAEAGGQTGSLGTPTTDETCGLRNGGCVQRFQNGLIYWSPGTGAHVVSGYAVSRVLLFEPGPLGYPTTDTTCGLASAGCYQDFEFGSLYGSSSTPMSVLTGEIRDRWIDSSLLGSIGYPLTDTTCGLVGGGCSQTFQNGSIHFSPVAGTRIVSNGPVRDRWGASGWEHGRLGYPVSDTTCGLADGGCRQDFQGGSLFDSASTPVQVVVGAIRGRYLTSGAEGGPLGYPTADERCGLAGGGCSQAFVGGSIVWSPAAGARVVRQPIAGHWTARGGVSGVGYPVSDTVCGLPSSGCYQLFERGVIYVSSSTAPALVLGAIRQRWQADGAEWGPLGYPTADERCGLAGGGCSQAFTGGSIFWSATTGARSVRGAILSHWTGRGGVSALGYPVTDTTCGLVSSGCYQIFQRGTAYVSSGTGAAVVLGAIRDRWAATGLENGPLGYPTGDERCGLVSGGCSQTFTGGSVFWSPTTGAHSVRGAIGAAWTSAGAEQGSLGYPVEEERAVSGGSSQRFTGGTLTWSSTTGQVQRS